MSLSSLINQYAASNPQVANAVSSEAMNSAILQGTLSGDTATSNLLGALYSQETENDVLLNSANPLATIANSNSNGSSNALGGTIDLQA